MARGSTNNNATKQRRGVALYGIDSGALGERREGARSAHNTDTERDIFSIFLPKRQNPIFSPRRKWNIKITFDDGHNEAYKYFIKIARLHTKYWSIDEREIQVAIMVIFAIQFYHPMNHSDQSDRISKWQINKVWNTGLYQHSHRDESLMCSQNV